MSVVKLTLPNGEMPVNGKQVTFIAPCTCLETEALQIDGENYTVVDTLGNCVTGIGDMWQVGAVITVVLDVDNKKAYMQNYKLNVAHGSYTGTGVYGSNDAEKRNMLTFDFPPKVVFVAAHSSSSGANLYNATFVRYASYAVANNALGAGKQLNLAWHENNLYWHSTESEVVQMNTSGKVYYYTAIG